MPASSIDAILQLAPPPRASETPSRQERDGSAFGPALERAYASERTREAPAPAAAEEEPVGAAPVEESNADGGVKDRTEGANEEGEIDSHSDGATEETDSAEETDDDLNGDVLVISDLASVALAADDVQAELTAEEATATGSAEGAARSAGKPTNLLSGDGDKAAKGEAAHAEAMRGGERTGDGVEAANAEAAADKPVIEKQLIKEQSPVEKPGATAEVSSEGDKQTDSRTAKGDGAEKGSLPPVEQSVELTAAIERQVKLVDQSGTAESASAESPATPAVDASNNGTSSQRAAATLDRLAATSLRRGDEAAQADGGPQIDRPRFVQRVEGALRAAQQRDGRVQVRLAPPELGVVHIELAVQNGVMTAKLEAETAAARNALLDNLPALRERLAEQNIRVEKFDVDVRRDPQQGGSNNAPGDRPDGQGESSPHGRRGRPVTTSMHATAPKTPRTASSASNSGLDVRI